jgi:hypothetical protein
MGHQSHIVSVQSGQIDDAVPMTSVLLSPTLYLHHLNAQK